MSQIPATAKTVLKAPGGAVLSPRSPAAAACKLLPPRNSSGNRRSTKKDKEQPQESQKEQDVDISTLPPTVSHEHRNLQKCPCGTTGKSTWKIDCSKCRQMWHVECVSLSGLNKEMINRLVDYLCPFCYVAPIPTQVNDPGTCLVCRNTISLQESNSLHETSLATEKFKSIDELSKAFGSVNFEAIKEQLDRVEIVDSRIKHLLLDEESLKEQVSRQKVIEDTVVGLQGQITSLHDQLKDISHNPPSQCNASVSDELIQRVSDKLDELRTDDPRVCRGLEGLQTSVERLEQVTVAGVQGEIRSIHDGLRESLC